MNTLIENIALKMKELGLNPTRLAKVAGLNQPTVARILSGEIKSPKSELIKKIATALGVTEWELRGDLKSIDGEFYRVDEPQAAYLEQHLISEDATTQSAANVIKLSRRRVFRIPLISYVQAGAFCEAIDNFSPGDAEEWLLCPKPCSKSTYALKVVGDSMTSPYPHAKSYPEGTVIFVDPEEIVTSGKMVIAKLMHSNEVTFKKYVEDAGKKWLIPINPIYEKIELVDGMHICGVVIFSGNEE